MNLLIGALSIKLGMDDTRISFSVHNVM